MKKVRLEINKLTIHRPKERWKIYFVIMVEHPTDPEKMVLSTIPTNPIRMTPNLNNVFQFDSQEEGSEGLLLLRREMPASNELNVHCYVRHSRSDVRDAGAIMKDIKDELGTETLGEITNILGTTNPWLVISKAAIPLIGKILTKVKDREMGFISMFERFGEEFENDGEIDREKTGGFSTLVYTWSVDK